MNTRELITTLGITRGKLAGWLKQGLPCVRRKGRRVFSAAKVEDWLLASGLATRSMASTIGEAAQAIGVHPRTLATWLHQGAPGPTADGYDLAAIRAWRRQKRAKKPESKRWQQRYQAERAKLVRLNRLQRQGELIDRSEAIVCWELIARRLRAAGETLQKTFGPPAAKILNEALEDCGREMDSLFPPEELESQTA